MAVEKVTDEQIAAWKVKHGDVFYFESEDGTWCFLFKPTRTTLDAFFANSKNVLKAIETVVKNCWLAGDESFKSEEYKLLSLGEHLETIMEVKKTSLRKL